jgi:ParB family chromosome partitioning protein
MADKQKQSFNLKGFNDIFGAEPNAQDEAAHERELEAARLTAKEEARAEFAEENKDKKTLALIPLDAIEDFPGHPFPVVEDEEMQDLRASITRYGVQQPLVVRRAVREDGSEYYQMVTGHRRKYICEQLGMTALYADVQDITLDEATGIMTDTNLTHRQKSLTPSVLAKAYKMRLDAMNRQGQRTDLTLSQVGTKLRSHELLAQEVGESRNQIHRYIRLTYLIPSLLEMVDNHAKGLGKKHSDPARALAFIPAVELSYLSEEAQQAVATGIACFSSPTLAQAQALRKQYEKNEELTDLEVESILDEKKPNEVLRYHIPQDYIRTYIPEAVKESADKNAIAKHIAVAVQYYYEHELKPKAPGAELS